MIINEIRLPNIIFPYGEQPTKRNVVPGQPFDYINKVNLTRLAATDRSLAALVAYMAPGHRINIHMDYVNGPEQVQWSVLIGGHGLILEIYDKKDPDAEIDQVPAPNNEYSVPTLALDDAVLIESKCITDNPIIFNPTICWHSVYNPTDKWIKCVSLRSKSEATATYLQTLVIKT